MLLKWVRRRSNYTAARSVSPAPVFPPDGSLSLPRCPARALGCAGLKRHIPGLPALGACDKVTPMVRCQELVDLLMDYLDGELAAPRAAALEVHLNGCSPCLAFLNTYRSTIQVSRDLTAEEIPAELTERLLDFLKRERNQQGQAG